MTNYKSNDFPTTKSLIILFSILVIIGLPSFFSLETSYDYGMYYIHPKTHHPFYAKYFEIFNICFIFVIPLLLLIPLTSFITVKWRRSSSLAQPLIGSSIGDEQQKTKAWIVMAWIFTICLLISGICFFSQFLLAWYSEFSHIITIACDTTLLFVPLTVYLKMYG